jgi:hypothetical protein
MDRMRETVRANSDDNVARGWGISLLWFLGAVVIAVGLSFLR